MYSVRQVGLYLLQAYGIGGELSLVKYLLLHAAMRDDNSANNGGILCISGLLITM